MSRPVTIACNLVIADTAYMYASSHVRWPACAALAGNVKRLNPKFDLKVKKQAVTRLLKAAATDAQVWSQARGLLLWLVQIIIAWS